MTGSIFGTVPHSGQRLGVPRRSYPQARHRPSFRRCLRFRFDRPTEHQSGSGIVAAQMTQWLTHQARWRTGVVPDLK